MRKHTCKQCKSTDFYIFGLCKPCFLEEQSKSLMLENAEKIIAATIKNLFSITRRATKKRMYSATRRAQKKNAIPSWFGELDDLIMQEAADLCVRREKSIGIKWHIDHIVPIKSNLVCGLHIGCNIQVITAKQNMTKHNSYWPNMP